MQTHLRDTALGALALAAAAATALALAACGIVLGPLNQDEGWYLLAALNVADGALPYRDFLYTQGPVMPYFYAAFAWLWAPFGMLGGRVFTSALGLASVALWCGAAKRLRGNSAAPSIVFLLLACNPAFSYFTAIPKTYALASFFISIAFYALAGKARLRIETAALALALAAGTRLSLGILLAIAGLWLILNARRAPRLAWLRFGIAGALALFVIYAPFLALCHEQFVFSQTYHTARAGGGLASWIALRGGFVSRLLQGYFLVFAAAALGIAGFRRFPKTILPAAAFLAASALHLFAPFPYDDYQTPAMPLAAVCAAVWISSIPGLAWNAKTKLAAAALALAFAASSPMLMDWMLIRQDRFWFEMKTKPDILVLRETGAKIKQHLKEKTGAPLLFTQDAYLAVEAGARVPRGLEMGPFSIFPDLSDTDARKYNVHNLSTLRAEIETTEAPAAALSGYAFAMSCPSTEKLLPEQSSPLFEAISNRFDRAFSVAEFGQRHTRLDVFTAKHPESKLEMP